MGTFGSALICQNCKESRKGDTTANDNKDGLLMVIKQDSKETSAENNSVSSDALWKCNTCSFTKTDEDVENLCFGIHAESEDLINSVPDQNSIKKFETFIKKYAGSILHTNHMLLTNLKYSLCGFYGRLPGYEMQEMSVAALTRKKQICDETLQVLNRIDPGISPRRGLFILSKVFSYTNPTFW